MTLTVKPQDLPASIDTRPHAVVIGAGFGGLAAAIRLSVRGYRVTVLERLDQPGGRARVFRQDGFTFDGGPTILTAPFLFEALWTLCGERMEDSVTLSRLEPGYTVRFPGGEEFRCFASDEKMDEEVARFSPADVAGYRAFMAESKAMYESAFDGLVDEPFSTLSSMLRILPALVRRRADRSVHGLVARYVSDPKLRVALSFHPLFVGGNPFRTSSVMALIAHLERTFGIHYVMGGTGALVRAMSELGKRQGARFRFETTVEEILVKDGAAAGVRLDTGETIDADIVVANGDAAYTHRNLLPGTARRRWSDRKIDRAAHSMGLFIWYFGTRTRYPKIDHHTIMMGPRYRELLVDIFDRKTLADDFSLYLHRPSATDASVAPEGHDAFYVLSPVPNLQGSTDWTEKAEPYRKAIEAHLEKTLMPGLSDNIVTSRVVTPLDFRDDLLSIAGAAFGMEPRLTQIAWFRPHNVCEDVRNLFLVGAGTHPGAGMPGVIASASILDKVVPDAAAFR